MTKGEGWKCSTGVHSFRMSIKIAAVQTLAQETHTINKWQTGFTNSLDYRCPRNEGRSF